MKDKLLLTFPLFSLNRWQCIINQNDTPSLQLHNIYWCLRVYTDNDRKYLQKPGATVMLLDIYNSFSKQQHWSSVKHNSFQTPNNSAFTFLLIFFTGSSHCHEGNGWCNSTVIWDEGKWSFSSLCICMWLYSSCITC